MLTLLCLSCSPYHPKCKDYSRRDDVDEIECHYGYSARKIVGEYEKTGRVTNGDFLKLYLAQKGVKPETILKLLPEE